MLRNWQRFGGGGLDPLIALGAAWYYDANSAYMLLDGGNGVIAWADRIDLSDPNRDYLQGAAAARPVYKAFGSAPSGAPCVNGDGINDFVNNLFSSSGVRNRGGPGVSSTWYTAVYTNAFGGAKNVSGSDNNGTGGRARTLFNGNNSAAQLSLLDTGGSWGGGNRAGWIGAIADDAAGTIQCLSSEGDGPGLVSGSGAAASASLFAFNNGGVHNNFADIEIYVDVGFLRVLSASERAIVQSTLAMRMGI